MNLDELRTHLNSLVDSYVQSVEEHEGPEVLLGDTTKDRNRDFVQFLLHTYVDIDDVLMIVLKPPR